MCGRDGAAENKAFPLSFVDFGADVLCEGAMEGVLTESWPPLCLNFFQKESLDISFKFAANYRV